MGRNRFLVAKVPWLSPQTQPYPHIGRPHWRSPVWPMRPSQMREPNRQSVFLHEFLPRKSFLPNTYATGSAFKRPREAFAKINSTIERPLDGRNTNSPTHNCPGPTKSYEQRARQPKKDRTTSGLQQTNPTHRTSTRHSNPATAEAKEKIYCETFLQTFSSLKHVQAFQDAPAMRLSRDRIRVFR